ncbi:Ig-like domain-containing protein [Chitinophaga nivalis]|uniref:T9SS type A sorting domain-containing protein n=1 Tax=Chitinophaga nivalis TaxID=2991709 RepID=A0ABT3IMV4_9BACT|nr:T9SS type A sorting domain-containing protein [Chitinophaga nivalis]MCW3465010.1 T9SS type A sorting domain-containing protein [Chitinophaga nivalis]MCW3485298.1 T9SS type A sorting domain-containing protein [Chitinophaga nivalis]
MLIVHVSLAQPIHCVRATSFSTSGPAAVTSPGLAVDNDRSTAAGFLFRKENVGAKFFLSFPVKTKPGDSLNILFKGTTPIVIKAGHVITYDGDTELEKIPLSSFSVEYTNAPFGYVFGWQYQRPFDKIAISLEAYNYTPEKVDICGAYHVRALPYISNTVNVCEGAAEMLHITGPENAVFKWYVGAIGGVPIFTGADFKAPTLFRDTTFYVETTDATTGCTNESRKRVNLRVSPTAATFSKQWNKTFGGSGLDDLYHVSLTLDGGYLLCGTSASANMDVTDGNNGQQDFLAIKTDSAGTKQWNKTYGGSGNDVLLAAIKAPGNGYLLTGYTTSADKDITDGNNGGEDAWMVRVDNTGNKLWDKTFGGTGNDRINAVVASPEGGYLLGGYTWSDNGDVTDGNNGKSDIWIVRMGTGGVKLWDKTFGGNNLDVLTTIAATPDSGYLLGGYSRSSNADITDGNNGAEDYWIIKIDANGNKQWNKTYGGSGADILKRVLYTEDGGYLLAGTSTSSDWDVSSGNKGGEDFWVVKTDASGNKEWEKSYGGSSYDLLTSVQSIPGGWLLGGYTRSANGDITTVNKGEDDFLIAVIGYTGKLGSTFTLGGSKVDQLYSLRTTNIPGEVILGGFSFSTDGDISDGNNGLEDFLLAKIKAAYNCDGGMPAAAAILADTIKPAIPRPTTLKVFPNPFSQQLALRYTVKKEGRVRLQLFHISGTLMATLKDEWMSAGTYQLQVNGNGYPAGSYILRLQESGSTQVTSLIKSD